MANGRRGLVAHGNLLTGIHDRDLIHINGVLLHSLGNFLRITHSDDADMIFFLRPVPHLSGFLREHDRRPLHQ